MIGLVTITRNSMSTLRETINSLAPVRDIVSSVFVDGKSSDGTTELLRSYCEQTENATFLEQQSEGLYGALNEGVGWCLSQSEISHIGLLHSDDLLLEPGFSEYAKQVRSSGSDIYYSDIVFHNSTGHVVREWISSDYSILRLKTGWMPPHTSMVVSRAVYEECGRYDPAFGTAADYEWIVRVFRSGSYKSSYIPRKTVSMLIGGASSAGFRERLEANMMDGRVWREESLLQRGVVRILKPARKIFQFKLREKITQEL